MTTMKGLLKGLKYFQQIFENEEEEEIKIGFPTDVKHVAHIGWDGPSASAPSWMTEFKPTDGASSAPAGHGDAKEGGAPHGESVSEDSVRSAASARTCPSPARDVPDVPKSTRRHGHSSSTSDSPRAKGKTRHSRRASKGSLVDGSESNRELTGDGALGSESPMRNNPAPDVPKRSRRKKSKDSPVGGSARTSGRASKAQASSTSYDEPQFMDQDQPVRFKSAELGKASNMEAFEEREDKRISIVS